MPLSTLDPKPALIAVDLQKGLQAAPTVHDFNDIASKTRDLAAAFRSHGFPVVLVNVTGGAPGRTDAGHPDFTPPPDWADLVDELDVQDGDRLVTKQRWGAFHGTCLHDHLQSQGATQLFLTGVATSIGVESTARAAAEHGYHVVLVTDAMTDIDPDAHVNSVERIFPRLGETTTSVEVLRRLSDIA